MQEPRFVSYLRVSTSQQSRSGLGLAAQRDAVTRPPLPPMAVKVQGKLYTVETYAEASEMVLAALAKYNGYFRDLPEIGFYEGKRKTGHVSTNGKVWLRSDDRDYQVWPPRTDLPPLVVTPPPATSGFVRRQRVCFKRLVGPRFEADWSEKATIVGRHEGTLDGNWYVVQFADGGGLSVHASNLMASNEPPFKGRLPSYASTQRCAP